MNCKDIVWVSQVTATVDNVPADISSAPAADFKVDPKTLYTNPSSTEFCPEEFAWVNADDQDLRAATNDNDQMSYDFENQLSLKSVPKA